MTYYDHKGKKVNSSKEIWITDKSTNVIIEEELCKQVNNAIIKNINEIKIIKKFIKNSL